MIPDSTPTGAAGVLLSDNFSLVDGHLTPDVILQKVGTNKRIPYNADSDTDTARGTALLAALDDAEDGDLIKLGAGTFDLGTGTLDLQLGAGSSVSLIGAGMNLTEIVSGAGSVTSEATPIVVPPVAGTIADLTITGDLSDGKYQYPIGCTTANSNFTDLIIRNVAVSADAGGIYIYLSGACYGKFYNLRATARGVAGVLVGGGVYELFNCYFYDEGPSATPLNGSARGLFVSGPTVHAVASFFAAINGGNNANEAVLVDDGLCVLIACRASASNTGTVTPYHLYCASGTLIYDPATQFDETPAINGGCTKGTAWGITPGATGLALLDDTSAAAARNTLGASGGVFPESVGGTGLSTRYRFIAQSSLAGTNVQSLRFGAWNTIDVNCLDEEVLDEGGAYTLSTATFTAPVDGYYKFHVILGVNGIESSRNLFLSLLVNGSTRYHLASDIGSTGKIVAATSTRILHLSATDTVNLSVYNADTGNNRDTANASGTSYNYFSGELIRAD